MVGTFQNTVLIRKLVTSIGKPFAGKSMKNMKLVTEVIEPTAWDSNEVSPKRIGVYDYPLFIKMDPL